MTATTEHPLTAAELQRRLNAADPAAFLIEPRLLSRVIKEHAGTAGFGVHLPHGFSYAIDSAVLLRLIDPADLGLPASPTLPPKVILLPRPDDATLAATPPEQLLVRCWRRLFHAHVHLALEQKAADGKLTDADVRERLRRLGDTELDEVRTVLRQEKTLLPPADDRTVWVEFTASYLELRFFEPQHLADFFPTLAHRHDLDALVAEDVDAAALLRETRLEGTPDLPSPVGEQEEDEDEVPPQPPPEPAPPAPGEAHELHGEAEEAAGRGNLVRAAILKTRAGAEAADAELDLFVARLRRTLHLDARAAHAWRQVMPPLLAGAASGFWTAEARLLYDLQKACVDSERGVFAVSPIRWMFSGGSVPLKRPLPAQQAVLVLKHLRQAQKRVHAVRLTEPERDRLGELLHAAVEHTTVRLRARFRPAIADALEKVELLPANLPERVARDKLIDELLDRLCERYLLTLGDVRDAVSRNQLKLPDLSGPGELLRGDQLLRLDRLLAEALDGIYRAGEVYLRGLQRLSSLGFATQVGRFLTLYFLLPFAISFVALKGTGLLIDEGAHGLRWLGLLGRHDKDAVKEVVGYDDDEDEDEDEAPPAPTPPATAPAHHDHVRLATPWSVGLLTVFLLLLIHVRFVREEVLEAFRLLGGVLHAVFIDAPAWLFRLPAVRALLASPPVTFLRRHALTALFVALAVGALTLLAATLTRHIAAWVARSGRQPLLAAADLQLAGLVAAVVFLVGLVVFNTRFGRDLAERLEDLAGWVWVRLSVDFFPGLFRLVMWLSQRFLEGVERLLYTVDEWLRFRGGDSRLSLVLKAVVSPIWYVITYVVRIYTNLLIEPTVNPIKHFPVVTVGHKLMFPFLLPLYHFLVAQVTFLGPVGEPFVVLTIFFIPGIFGFIVWELKENWKLYRANRSETLRPVVVGSHGETVLRLLRPGFHSGPVPKIYRRLRRAERRGRAAAAHKQQDALHHAEEGVRHFVEREFVHLLALSKSWGGLRLELGEVGLCTNRIRVELTCADLPGEGVEVVIDLRGGRLVAAVTREGWLPRLSGAQQRAFTVALAGLYKLAGVELTREQVEAALAPGRPPYRIERDALVVRPGEGAGKEAVYPLDEGPVLRPRGVGGPAPADLPVLHAERLLFREVPITWVGWVAAWDRDASGLGPPPPFPESVQLLPHAGMAA